MLLLRHKSSYLPLNPSYDHSNYLALYPGRL